MKKFNININIEVSDNWIQDGFDPTNNSWKEWLINRTKEMLPYAYDNELKCSVEVTEIPSNPNAAVEQREADKTIESFKANHTGNKKIILYRDHTGSLEESMKTVQEVTCEADIINHLNKFWKGFGKEVEELKFYHIGLDERIDWDTYIVRFRLKGSAVFEVAGQTNGTFTTTEK